MTYRERPTSVPGAVLWQRTAGPGSELIRILPDGCLDLVWDGDRLFVAGPDRTARLLRSRPGTRYVGLRFSGGAGPALLGIPADLVCDRAPDLEELWPAATARELAERIADAPEAGLEAWAIERAAARDVDPLGPRVLRMAAAGAPVSVIAGSLGVSTRHLHRRCLPVFGYGPRRLARVLRLGQAVAEARSGLPLAQVAAGCGYADQAHLSREMRALAGTTPSGLLREVGGGELREQVDRRAVGVEDDGVAHPPEGVPRPEVSRIPGLGELRPGGVHLRRGVTGERQGDPMAAPPWR